MRGARNDYLCLGDRHSFEEEECSLVKKLLSLSELRVGAVKGKQYVPIQFT